MRGSFKTLSVYQDALHLVDLSYELIKIFPKQEKTISQINFAGHALL